MAGKYGVLAGRALAQASDRDLYDFAVQYAQRHAFGTPGLAAPAQRIGIGSPELGRGQGIGGTASTALARRKALIQSLGRRRTESSRRRALGRVFSGFGLGLPAPDAQPTGFHGTPYTRADGTQGIAY